MAFEHSDMDDRTTAHDTFVWMRLFHWKGMFRSRRWFRWFRRFRGPRWFRFRSNAVASSWFDPMVVVAAAAHYQ